MNPTNAPPSPPPSASGNHLHSMETSSRFRNSDSRGEGNYKHPSNHGMSMSAAASLSSNKLRLLCSNGGHIVPRPHDKSLRYIGGETRMIVVDRHTTLPDLIYQLSKTLPRVSSSLKETSGKGYPFTLKYQLPSEDLDSLISLTTDEDLENMIDEYERLNPSSRIRLFVFPTNPASISSMSFMENLIKSEDRFVSVLNGMNSEYSDTSSFNCLLLNLDDDISPPEKNNVNQMGTDLKTNGSGQDVHSISDSPMMETTSSFGSASSTPSLVNLPAIRVSAGENQKVIGGIEEQFIQMSFKEQYYKHQNDGVLVDSPAPEVVSGSPVSFGKVTGELSDPISSYIERSDQGSRMTYVKHQHQQQLQQQQQFQLKQSMGSNLASPDSVLSDLPGNDDRAADPIDIPDQHARNQNPACLLSMPTTQIDSPRNQLHHQQPQLIPLQHYIHHHQPSGPVPVASYYQHPQMDHQNFVYYMPARQLPQGYNFPVQQPQPSYDAPLAATIPPSDQTTAGGYMTTNSSASQPVRGPYVKYSEIQQPSQLTYYATQAMPHLSAAHYTNMKSMSPFEASLQEQHVRSALP